MSITSTDPHLPDYDLWPPAADVPGEVIFIPDGEGGGVVVGRVWESGHSTPGNPLWIGQCTLGNDRRHRLRVSRDRAAEAVIREWVDYGRPDDARTSAEATAEAER
jgi:hypothetical protein